MLRKNQDPILNQLKLYLTSQRDHPADNNIEYWNAFVKDFYNSYATEMWCFPEEPTLEGETTVPKWCPLCSKTSNICIEKNTFTLAERLKDRIQRGVLYEYFRLNGQKVYVYYDSWELDCRNVSRHVVYDGYTIVYNGRLTVMFNDDLKITTLNFCVEKFEVIPNDGEALEADYKIRVLKIQAFIVLRLVISADCLCYLWWNTFCLCWTINEEENSCWNSCVLKT